MSRKQKLQSPGTIKPVDPAKAREQLEDWLDHMVYQSDDLDVEFAEATTEGANGGKSKNAR